VRRLATSLGAFSLLALASACDPFGLPATRALEDGVASMLTSSRSFEIAGQYVAGPDQWKMDMQVVRPDTRHIALSSTQARISLEALIVGRVAYFRGRQFLADRLRDNPLGPSLVNAAGDMWWRDTTIAPPPSLPDFTDGAAFRASFLGSAATSRLDHQRVGADDAVELSGARADVYIGTVPPFRLLRVQLKRGVTVDGIVDADLRYSNVDADFHLSVPTAVIDFANLSTLPPIYTVTAIDTSACGSPCVVSATVRNLGGGTGAHAPSTVVFTLSDPVSALPLGTCTATIQPDVGYNVTTTASCSMTVSTVNAAVVTASVNNPGRG